MVMFRIISRRHWAQLQDCHKAHPGATVEHLHYGLYVVMIPAAGASEVAA